MLCNESVTKLDDFLDGELASQEAWRLQRHIDRCASCAGLLSQGKALRQALAELPVADPGEDFFERALHQAVQTPRRETRSWLQRTSRSIAAVAAVLLIAGVALQAPIFSPSSEIPQVTITLHEVTPVNLKFASKADLKDARLSLQLPEGVELAGYTGRRALSWRTDLRKGDNLLRLPLLGSMASSDRLTAELEHPDGAKSFALQITVN